MTEFLGSLYIFVDARGEDGGTPSAPALGDVFGSADPGGMLWYLSGWAVGKNARGSYCARTSVSKLRTFATFAAAMDFVRKKRKTRPQEQFHLVYEAEGRKSIVTSLEQILRLDGRTDGAEHGAHADTEETPELVALTERVGKIVATNALLLLKTLTREGEAVAMTRFSKATYERLWQVLRDAGLVGGGTPDAADALEGLT